MTKQEAGEYVRVHFGIKNGEVVKLWETRGGQLSKSGAGPSHDLAGRPATSDRTVVFGLSDAFDVPIMFIDAESTKQRVKELEEKATKQRAEKEAKGKDQEETP